MTIGYDNEEEMVIRFEKSCVQVPISVCEKMLLYVLYSFISHHVVCVELKMFGVMSLSHNLPLCYDKPVSKVFL